MDDLLSRVLEAHGGLRNWAKVTTLTARLSMGGPFWAARGVAGIYDQVTAELDAHREHIVVTPYTASDRRSIFDVGPDRVAIEGLDGRRIEERIDPRASFPLPFGPTTTRWDALQVAYFGSYANWNYLTTPFLLTYPGVEARETDPWEEEGETWHRLRVTFPTTVATHSEEQLFYFGDDYLLRRLDYQPDVTSRAPIAHYVADHKEFGGFLFPTRRTIHVHDSNGVADRTWAAITIAIDDVVVSSRAVVG